MNKIVLNDDELKELYKRLRTVVTVNDAKFLLKKYTLEEIKTKAFLRSKNSDKESFLDNSEIEVIDTFNYVQEGDNPFCFNPTISDVLADIPKNSLKNANAFEISDAIEYKNNCFSTKVMTYKIHKK